MPRGEVPLNHTTTALLAPTHHQNAYSGVRILYSNFWPTFHKMELIITNLLLRQMKTQYEIGIGQQWETTMKRFSRINSLFFLIAFALSPAGSAADKTSITDEAGRLARHLIDTYQTPGIAIAIVKGSNILHAEGYGQRSVEKAGAINKHTYFRVASVSKAFTAASLATLVDEGKLDWDDPVIKHLPDFQMADPWVTREFTIRDLLTHRSGLGPGAGDLMLWPAPTKFTRQQIVHNLRYLKPVSSFRSEYAYDNLLYIVAGEVVAKITGESWETYVQKRLMKPLGDTCYAAAEPTLKNVATPHQLVEGQLETVPRNAVTAPSPVYAAAGGVSCNIVGLADWMRTWIAGGRAPSGHRLFSEAQRDEMWRGVTLMNPSRYEREIFGSHFKSYSLAWRKTDAMGYQLISHTGSLSGARAWVAIVPELKLGIAVIDNGSNSKVRNILMPALLAKLTGQDERDWAAHIEAWYQKVQQRHEAEKPALPEGTGSVLLSLKDYAGAYEDNWFGQVDITLKSGALQFASQKSPKMIGTLEPHSGHTFIVRWHDRSFEADAWVKFESDFAGSISGIQMKAISDDADSSFDFHDLHFRRLD